MPASTRELPVRVIFVVTLVAVVLLAAIVLAAEAGFHYFQNRQAERQYDRGADRTYAETGLRIDNTGLARLNVEQRKALNQPGDGQQPIAEAMKTIAERY